MKFVAAISLYLVKIGGMPCSPRNRIFLIKTISKNIIVAVFLMILYKNLILIS
jgi:hypothetical protein